MQDNVPEQYRKAKIETASPGRLILLGYENIEGAISNAIDFCENKNYLQMNEELIRSQKIINEFIMALNMSAGQISNDLFRIYSFWVKKLIEANLNRDAKQMLEIKKMVAVLHNSWIAAVKQVDTSLTPSRTSNIEWTG